ncbi:MAG: RpiB/LacA/LacB family sugar-phosphate isomerase [Pseudomonadota bacterium]
MKIAIAGDSAGAPLAKALAEHFGTKAEFDVAELSTPPARGAEYYANLAERVAAAVLDGTYERAILCCGTGIGVCLSANKVTGIRAAQTHDTYSARKAATSNNAQIITFGARVIGPELAKDIAEVFLSSTFDPLGPSAGNVKAIDDLDARNSSAMAASR